MRSSALVAVLLVAALATGCTLRGVLDRGPGSAAQDLVAKPTLVIEIDHPAGDGPDASALAAFRGQVQAATGRDAAHVQVVTEATVPSEPSRRYSVSDLAALERTHRSRETSGDTAVLYVLYVSGGSTSDTDEGKVLGVAYGGTSVAIFKGNVKGNTGGLGQPQLEFVERAVLIHEFGHAAGLVNLGAPMVTAREDTRGGEGDDPARRGHSTSKDSVMYWAVENTGGLIGVLGCTIGFSCTIPYQFDANDKADLKALREK